MGDEKSPVMASLSFGLVPMLLVLFAKRGKWRRGGEYFLRWQLDYLVERAMLFVFCLVVTCPTNVLSFSEVGLLRLNTK
jgi:hypothetical protein